jgi:hypothetical protein
LTVSAINRDYVLWHRKGISIRTTSWISFVLTAALSLLTASIYAKAAYAVDVNASKDQQPIKVQPHFLNYSNLTYGIEPPHIAV